MEFGDWGTYQSQVSLVGCEFVIAGQSNLFHQRSELTRSSLGWAGIDLTVRDLYRVLTKLDKQWWFCFIIASWQRDATCLRTQARAWMPWFAGLTMPGTSVVWSFSMVAAKATRTSSWRRDSACKPVTLMGKERTLLALQWPQWQTRWVSSGAVRGRMMSGRGRESFQQEHVIMLCPLDWREKWTFGKGISKVLPGFLQLTSM